MSPSTLKSTCLCSYTHKLDMTRNTYTRHPFLIYRGRDKIRNPEPNNFINTATAQTLLKQENRGCTMCRERYIFGRVSQDEFRAFRVFFQISLTLTHALLCRDRDISLLFLTVQCLFRLTVDD